MGKTKIVDSGEPNAMTSRFPANVMRRPKVAMEEVELRFKELRSTLNRFELQRMSYVPERHIDLFKKAALGLASRKSEAKLMCLECMGWSDTVASIRGCTARLCPLWNRRPYQAKGPSSV